MQDTALITDVAHVIQLAVAPVFLLTGVSGILSVLVNRLARIVDRFRTLDNEYTNPTITEQALTSIKIELTTLAKRAKLIHWAIGLCTSCALLICLVVAILFTSAMMAWNLGTLISVAFILAMSLLVAGLVCFLNEITIARSSIHVIPH